MLRGRRGGLPLAALVVVTALAVSAQGHVLLHRCVEAGGSWAGIAVRLAVLRDTAACPDGTMGLGALPNGAVVLMSVALPVLAAWAAAAALGIGLGALGAHAVRVLAGLVRRWVVLPAERTLPVPDDHAPVPLVTAPARPPALGLLVARQHRAPPLPA